MSSTVKETGGKKSYSFFFATLLIAVLSLLLYSSCDKGYWGVNDYKAPPNTLPDVTITNPLDGNTYTEGDSITFSGSVYDVDEGALMNNCQVWTSSVDSQIGRGASFSRNDLSAGAHIITLTARDSEGDTASNSVSITINPIR